MTSPCETIEIDTEILTNLDRSRPSSATHARHIDRCAGEIQTIDPGPLEFGELWIGPMAADLIQILAQPANVTALEHRRMARDLERGVEASIDDVSVGDVRGVMPIA